MGLALDVTYAKKKQSYYVMTIRRARLDRIKYNALRRKVRRDRKIWPRYDECHRQLAAIFRCDGTARSLKKRPR